MKHLKLFESWYIDSPKYKVGDYIKTEYGINNLGRIFKIKEVDYYNAHGPTTLVRYKTENFDGISIK